MARAPQARPGLIYSVFAWTGSEGLPVYDYFSTEEVIPIGELPAPPRAVRRDTSESGFLLEELLPVVPPDAEYSGRGTQALGRLARRGGIR